MSKNANRLPAEQALEIAKSVRSILMPGCTRIGIAGSLRRRCETVGDIEFVIIPKVERGPAEGQLFATDVSRPIYRIVDKLATTPRFSYGHAQQGNKYRKLFYRVDRPVESRRDASLGETHIGIDLFFTQADTWGNIFAIRTGPAEFSKLLVTARNPCDPDNGGAMPPGWRQRDGKLWNSNGEPVACPEEKDFFDALGLPCWEPADRRVSTLRQHLRSGVLC